MRPGVPASPCRSPPGRRLPPCSHQVPSLCSALFVLPFDALIESSLEEELNRVCGGMLVMPDLLFGVYFWGVVGPVAGTRPD